MVLDKLSKTVGFEKFFRVYLKEIIEEQI